MDIQFTYQKKRYEFGRKCYFTDEDQLIDDLPSNTKLLDEYILRNPASQGTQLGITKAAHSVNTVSAEYTTVGINHIEGGWPKDISPLDDESSKRYRRKIEKEENYTQSLMFLMKNAEDCILENNAINIHEQYFADFEDIIGSQRSSVKSVNVFKNPNVKVYPVSYLSWDPDNGKKIAVSYCSFNYPFHISDNINSCVWDVEDPSDPILTIKSESPISCLEYHQKDSYSLCTGHINGKVGVVDLRKEFLGNYSKYEESHKDPVLSVLWINSKSGTEFFSGSLDGWCKWWDTRKLTEPLDSILIAPVKEGVQSLNEFLGVFCLDYDSSMPTRFMAGTEEGMVVLCNRKGKSAAEKLVGKYSAHYGPVKKVQRNPAFSKIFLTIGDWSAKIFTEECRESPVIWTNYHRVALTDGTWSPVRPSVFFTTRSDGILDVWDILEEQANSSLKMKICDVALTKIKIQSNGEILSLGNDNGAVYLVQLSKNLSTFTKSDKTLLMAMLERESRREKILEARNKELKIKMKAKAALESVDRNALELMEKQSIIAAEEEFYEQVEAEKQKFSSKLNGNLEENCIKNNNYECSN